MGVTLIEFSQNAYVNNIIIKSLRNEIFHLDLSHTNGTRNVRSSVSFARSLSLVLFIMKCI